MCDVKFEKISTAGVTVRRNPTRHCSLVVTTTVVVHTLTTLDMTLPKFGQPPSRKGISKIMCFFSIIILGFALAVFSSSLRGEGGPLGVPVAGVSAAAGGCAPSPLHSPVAALMAKAVLPPPMPALISRSTDADTAAAVAPASPAAFFLPRDYVQRYNNSYDPEPAAAEAITSWQYNVYESARALAPQVSARSIIDVGCGSGVKLAKLRDVPGVAELYCLDFGSNLDAVISQFPFIIPLEIDLNRDISSLIPRTTLKDAIIINADNIEHVAEARGLLRAFRVWMQDAAALLLSTPDRAMHDHLARGPPRNRAHVREHSLCEMVHLFSKYGPRIAAAGWTENHSASRLPITLFIVALREDLSTPLLPPRVAPVGSAEDEADLALARGAHGHAIGRNIELPPSLYRPWRMSTALACVWEMQQQTVPFVNL